MNFLPNEILYSILSNLDEKSLANLSLTNKTLNFLINKDEFLWEQKCINIYKKSNKPKKYISWKSFYIKLYKNNCECCGKDTTRKHLFYKKIICYMCQKENIEYKTINVSRAKQDYSLTDKDLKLLKYKYSNNKFYGRMALKLYLEKDIIELNKKKFNSKFDEFSYILKKNIKSQQLLEDKHKNEMIIARKLLELDLNFNVINNLNDERNELNIYSSGLYNSFLRMKNPKEEVIYKIVKKTLEFYFIKKYSLFNYNNLDFKTILKMSLLDISIENEKTDYIMKLSDNYFKDDISEIHNKNSEMFKKRLKITLILQQEYNNYFIDKERILYTNTTLSSNIYNYIYGIVDYKKSSELREIIEDDILYYFFKYHTLISLINKKYFYKENVYTARLEALKLYLDHNGISSINENVYKCLINYFKHEDIPFL
jgi:hypothetical protein